MRKGFVWILVILMLFSTACGESMQKAPDYIMEGYDGDVTYRVWDTNLFFERMQEKTGISFQYSQYSDYDKWTQRKEELKANDNLPDVLFKAELNASEVRDLYQAGRIIDLAPYLEQYAPDLWKLLEEHPDWKKAITMADGAIPALPAINTLQNNDAMWINTAWLKKLKQDEIPLAFVGMWELRFLAHAFGMVDNDYYISEKEGIVSSSLTSEENRAFLTWLHQLWEEGLLDSTGFSTTDNLRQITDENKAIPYGVLLSTTPLTILPQKALEQYALLEPLSCNGTKVYRDFAGDLVRGTFAITSACKEPEKLVAWVNTLYTQEGSLMAYYGLEGEEYIWNENGTAPSWVDAGFQTKYMDEATRNVVESLQKLKQYSVIPYPPVTLSAEDEAKVTEIQSSLSRYAEKAMACFVTGDTELTDENWEEFCRTVEEKGLLEMIGIWQKAIQ